MPDNIRKSETIDGVRFITVPVGDNVDDATVEEAIRQLAPPVAGVVGNLADVQRAGAAIVAGDAKDFAAGVEVPPGTNAGDLKTAAAIEKAVEDSRTGRPSSVGDPNTGAAISGGTTYNTKAAK